MTMTLFCSQCPLWLAPKSPITNLDFWLHLCHVELVHIGFRIGISGAIEWHAKNMNMHRKTVYIILKMRSIKENVRLETAIHGNAYLAFKLPFNKIIQIPINLFAEILYRLVSQNLFSLVFAAMVLLVYYVNSISSPPTVIYTLFVIIWFIAYPVSIWLFLWNPWIPFQCVFLFITKDDVCYTVW